MSRLRLEGRTILVTGGARGIGRELTRSFVAEGARVVAVGRDAGALARLEAEHPGQVSAWPADLADPAQVDLLVRGLPARHPGLSIVVNNAAVQTLSDFLAGEAGERQAALRAEISLNFDAVVALSAGLLGHLRKHPAPAVVNVTSGLALAPKSSSPVYCATKAAVRSFTKALRYQCEDRAPHVQVVEAVMPLVDTDMTAGRGRGKISAARAASEIIAGLKAGRREIYVERARMLPALMRLSPPLVERIMRAG